MKDPTFAGKLLYHLYHSPRKKVQTVLRKGICASLYERRCESRMIAHAKTLRCPLTPEHDTTIHFLSGSQYWHQTVLCAYSFLSSSQYAPKICIWDDGTLTKSQKDVLKTFYSGVTIRETEEIHEALQKHLPEEKFPYLRQRRKHYPHLRKLTDIHCSATGWQLVFDSDMLFFRKPSELIEWMQNPLTPCHLIDSETSYGYSLKFLESIIQTPVLPKVNVGITGIASDEIDWELLEYWCRKMIEEQGTHYTQEQALLALYFSHRGQQTVAFDAKNYLVLPNESEARVPTAVMHHYVAESKSWYFRYGWQHIV